MKILITTDLFTTDTNGVVTSVKNLWDELKSQGHDVRILTFSENGKSRRDGDVYYVRSAPFPIYPDIRTPTSYRHQYIKEAIEWRPDIIHSQCEYFSFFMARYVSKRTNSPIVHTYHTLYEQYVKYVFPSARLGRAVLHAFLKSTLKHTACIIAPTEKVRASLVNTGIKTDIRVIPSGISLSQHKNRISPEKRREKRAEYGIMESHRVLVNLGRLGEEKNVDELLRYFKNAVTENVNLRFLIVGGGPAKSSLERLTKELGISDYVIFAGMVPPGSVHEYYQLGDIFVSASTSETQGLTYVEAAANGLPLLCRRDDCLLDVVKSGENGFVYDTEEDYRAHLYELMSSDEIRADMSKMSEKIALRYDKSVFGADVATLYEDVLGKTR